MKTYQTFQASTYCKIFLILLLGLPLGLTAKDDCPDLVKDAQKLAKSIEKLEEKAETAKTTLEEAQRARDEARTALESFDHPDDPAAHGSDTEQKRKKLARQLKKAEEVLLDAKADYYDALQKLIDELQALKDKLAEADEKCKNDQDKQDELDDIRDRHNLEARPGEAEEPENTQKQQDELVDGELKALLEAILEKLKEDYPDPEEFRSAVRKKIREIRDWKDGFWKTPLGKAIKERLEKALRETLEPSTEPGSGDSSEEEENSSHDAGEPGTFKSILPENRQRAGIGFSFGFSFGERPVWCPPQMETQSTITPLITSVSTTTDASVNQSDITAGSTNSNGENTFQTPQPEFPCLADWMEQPGMALMVEHPIGRYWVTRLGAYLSRATTPAVHTPVTYTSEEGIVRSEMIGVQGKMQGLELRAGLLRYLGGQRIRPLMGIQALYRRDKLSVGQPSDLETELWVHRRDRWGAQALAGLQIQILSKLEVAILGEWNHYFLKTEAAISRGVQVQFIWKP